MRNSRKVFPFVGFEFCFIYIRIKERILHIDVRVYPTFYPIVSGCILLIIPFDYKRGVGSRRGSERFTSCFCLSSKLDSNSFILVHYAGTSATQVPTLDHSPPFFFQRYKRVVGNKIQALRLDDMLCDFCN